jgi:hypothetical protein
MDDQRYRITYQLKHHPQGIALADIPENYGASDALIVISQLYPPDGSYSQHTSGLDGRTGGDIEIGELFKAWAVLANSLATNPELGPGQRLIAWHAHALMTKAITGEVPDPPKEIIEMVSAAQDRPKE